jgi:hypothetical protein
VRTPIKSVSQAHPTKIGQIFLLGFCAKKSKVPLITPVKKMDSEETKLKIDTQISESVPSMREKKTLKLPTEMPPAREITATIDVKGINSVRCNIEII